MSSFDALIHAAQAGKAAQDKTKAKAQAKPSESAPPAVNKKAKSADPDYVRTTIYLPKTLHKKLKGAAIDRDQEMSEIVEQLVFEWLENLDA